MSEQIPQQPRQIHHQRKEHRTKQIDNHQEHGQKHHQRRDPRPKQPPARNWQSRQHKHIQQLWKQLLPLKHRHHSHHHKGVHHVKVMVVHLRPERRLQRTNRGHPVIHRIQKQRKDQRRHGNHTRRRDQPFLRLSLHRHHVVVQEAVQQMPHQQLELAPLWLDHRTHSSLHLERKHRIFRLINPAQHFFKHASPSSPRPARERPPWCPAAAPAAQTPSPDSAVPSASSAHPELHPPQSSPPQSHSPDSISVPPPPAHERCTESPYPAPPTPATAP